jgi:protein-L-isoaspartate(D-aspartate) O-methyltransferase
MDTIEKYQKQLLEQTRHIYRETPISEPTERAYLAMPRHRFVLRYREWGTKEWHEVNDDDLAEHAATLYANRPLILYGDDDADIPSTISQPSFVLRMLDLLQLGPGHKVFELGAGSGWNAALMGQIVGPHGHVTSLEIIPELAKRAVETVESLGVANVQIVEGDGGNGFPDAAPYDRVIFTAGAFDLPRHFYEQIRDGGLLLVVIKSGGGGDNLFLLRKSGDHFDSLESMPCGFVQVRGKYQFEDLEPTTLEKAVPDWPDLQNQEVGRRRFWWGGKGKQTFVFTTMGVRSFLGIAEPTFRAFKTDKDDPQDKPEHHYFGLWDPQERSLVVAKDDWLVAYGNFLSESRLLERLRSWLDLGMPAAACLDLKVYPIDVPLEAGHQRWIVKRRDSQFLWTLQA